MKKLPRRRPRAQSDRKIRGVLRELLMNSSNPSSLLEIYYWSDEPQLTEFIRQFLLLSDSARATLVAFMKMTKGASESVRVNIGPKGEITLSSPHISDAMKLKSASRALTAPEAPELLQ